MRIKHLYLYRQKTTGCFASDYLIRKLIWDGAFSLHRECSIIGNKALFSNIPYQPNIGLKINKYISPYNGEIISPCKKK